MTRRLLPVLLLAVLAAGCSPSKTGSYYYTKKAVDAGSLDFGSRLRVDEYINAFPQPGLKPPPAGQAAALQVDYLQPELAAGIRKTLAQVAVRTRPVSREEQRDPLGLCIVLDTSGSMKDGNKLEDAKAALMASVRELNEGDEFALIVFNSMAEVAVAPVQIGQGSREKIIEKIGGLVPNGGTLIEEGLIEGYSAIGKFSSGVTSRMILITDGKSDVRLRTPEQLAGYTGKKYAKGVRISTVGIGLDVEEDVLRDIAEKSQGHYYFADKASTLTKILREDLRSTIMPVARDVNVTVEPAPGFRVVTVYGFENHPPDAEGRVKIPLGELNLDDWRILMVEVEGEGKGEIRPLRATLAYSEVKQGAASASSAPVSLQAEPAVVWGGTGAKSVNRDIARNGVIFANALALKEASRLAMAGKYQEAHNIITVQSANLEVVRSWDSSRSLENEAAVLAKVQTTLEKHVEDEVAQAGTPAPAVLAGIEPLTGAAAEAALEKERNARLRKYVKVGLDVASRTAPGPWGILIYAFSEVVLAD